MYLGGRFSKGGKEKTNPIPIIKEKLPHEDVFPKFWGERNNVPWSPNSPGEIYNALHEGATGGDDPTSELQGTNEGLKITQSAGMF